MIIVGDVSAVTNGDWAAVVTGEGTIAAAGDWIAEVTGESSPSDTSSGSGPSISSKSSPSEIFFWGSC